MIKIINMPDHPVRYMLIALLIGFGAVALVKIYGLFFMRWKTPFRLGETIGATYAEVVEWDGQKGYVSAGGELWRATSKDPLAPGDMVTVASVNGLMLTVSKQSA